MIKITAQFTKEDIRKLIEERKKRIDAAILSRLQFVGEQFVKNARERANFQDRTGNLRSSIGYVVLKNGLQKSGSDWIQVKEGGSGVKAGQDLIEELSRKYPTGYILIGVAGMDYAAAVESKGYDVITNSAGIAASSLKSALKKLSQKIQTL